MYGDADNNLPKLMDEQMLQWYSFFVFRKTKMLLFYYMYNMRWTLFTERHTNTVNMENSIFNKLDLLTSLLNINLFSMILIIFIY